MPTIERINRYPIKGLSPEPLQAVALATGEVLPLDRKFALARPGAPFDTERPAWLPKRNFLMLMVDERLAELQVGYHDETGRLTIDRAGQRLLEADVRDAEGRDAVERFFEAFMGEGLGGRPRLVSAAGHSFTDHAEKRISLINLDTVREIERRIGCPVDPLRFRGNLYVSGVPAWAELDGSGLRSSRARCAFESPSRSTAAPPQTSILRPGCATSTSRRPFASTTGTSTAASCSGSSGAAGFTSGKRSSGETSTSRPKPVRRTDSSTHCRAAGRDRPRSRPCL
jgi:uncharacterized protein